MNNNEKGFKITGELFETIQKHNPTIGLAFACIGSLAVQLTLILCASLHSEEPAHTIAKYLHGVADQITANAKEYAKANLSAEEEHSQTIDE